MASPRNKTQYIAIPAKHWVQRFTLVFLLLCAGALVVMSKNNHPAAERMRGATLDMVVPVVAAVSAPVEAFSDAGKWIGNAVMVFSQNQALMQENTVLLQWQTAAKQLQAENAALKQLLNAVPETTKHYITARMVSDVSGPYVNSALISAGSEDGLTANQAVITQEGLIGRVLNVGERSARILLLNDINSRIPVLLERTREKAILAGGKNTVPSLVYVPVNSAIAVGDRVVTSGDGGVIPPNIPVGVVTRVDHDGYQVQPFVDAGSTEFVTAVDYKF